MDLGGPKALNTDEIIRQQQRANVFNQTTPYGSLDIQLDKGGSRNDNRVSVNLSPQEQQILEQNQLVRLLGGQTAEGLFGDLGTGRADVEQAYFDRAAGLLRPEFARQEDQLRQRLANQGLPQSSGAFAGELRRFSDAQNRAYEQAALAAVLGGGQEQSRILSNIMGLATGTQPNTPTFVPPPQFDIPYQQPQQQASPLSGLLGLGGLALGGALGGPAGAGLGFQAGAQAPYLFGF